MDTSYLKGVYNTVRELRNEVFNITMNIKPNNYVNNHKKNQIDCGW